MDFIKNSIPKDKESLILDRSITEFSINGFYKTSTNKLTRECGISKGILFHYFTNKKNLYLYVLSHSLNTLTRYIIKSLKEESYRDYFDFISKRFLIKLKAGIRYHRELKIISDSYRLRDDKLTESIKSLYIDIQKVRDDFYENNHIPELSSKTVNKPELINTYKKLIDTYLEGMRVKYETLLLEDPDSLATIENDIYKEIVSGMTILKEGIYKRG